jgi:hypothetical protein
MSVKITLSDSVVSLPLIHFRDFPNSCVMAMANSFETDKELEIEMPLLSVEDIQTWLEILKSNEWDNLSRELKEKLEVYGLLDEGLLYHSSYLRDRMNKKEEKTIKFISKGGFFLCNSLEKFEMMKRNVFHAKEYIPCRISVRLTEKDQTITHVMLSESLLLDISCKLTKGAVDINRVKYDTFSSKTRDDFLYENTQKDYKDDIDYSNIKEETDSTIVQDHSSKDETLIPRLFHSDPSVVMSAVGKMNAFLNAYQQNDLVPCALFYKTYEEMKLKPIETEIDYSPVEVCKVLMENTDEILKSASRTSGTNYFGVYDWRYGAVDLKKYLTYLKYCVCYGFVKI